MNIEKLQTAIRALTDLMADELASAAPDRFARVQRLAILTQKLQKEAATNVKDFAALQMGQPNIMPNVIGMGDNVEDYGEVGGIHAMPRYVRPIGAEGDTVRNVVDALMPTMQAQGDAAQARGRRDRAGELNELIDAREQLGADTEAGRKLSKRIAQLVGDVTEDTEDGNVSMVSAEFLRGHLARTEDAAANPGDDPGAVTDGEGRDGGAHQTSPGRALAFGVGVSLGLGADEPAVDGPAVRDAQRADLGGAEDSGASTQTGS